MLRALALGLPVASMTIAQQSGAGRDAATSPRSQGHGPLYQVMRQADGQTLDIGVVPSPGSDPGGCAATWLGLPAAATAREAIPAPGTKLLPPAGDRVITAADIAVERAGTIIPTSAIGEPVGGVELSPPRWIEATANSVAHAVVEDSIARKDPKGKPIKFRVLLPARWSRLAIQVGGAGINGWVPMLRGERPDSATACFARYGSDPGHQMGQGDDWALNEEAIRSFPAARTVSGEKGFTGGDPRRATSSPRT